jgi:hypothetical protein
LLDARGGRVLEAAPGDNRGVREQSITDGGKVQRTVDTPGPVRLTIAWTDPPGTPPPPSVDPPADARQRLDVRTSVSGDVTTLPWTLDHLNPSAPRCALGHPPTTPE